MYAIPMMFLTHLPYDLERTILEYAARADRPMALTLLLVSREVKRWWARNQGFVCLPLTSWFRIEPILYRHITLNNDAQTDAFIHALNSPRPRSPQFFANVRSISFTYGVTFHQAAKILSVCSDITTLSCHIEFSRQNLNVSLDDIDNSWLHRRRRLSVCPLRFIPSSSALIQISGLLFFRIFPICASLGRQIIVISGSGGALMPSNIWRILRSKSIPLHPHKLYTTWHLTSHPFSVSALW